MYVWYNIEYTYRVQTVTVCTVFYAVYSTRFYNANVHSIFLKFCCFFSSSSFSSHIFSLSYFFVAIWKMMWGSSMRRWLNLAKNITFTFLLFAAQSTKLKIVLPSFAMCGLHIFLSCVLYAVKVLYMYILYSVVYVCTF